MLLHTTGNWYDWHPHPDVIALCVFVLVAYFYAVTTLRGRHSDARRIDKRQAVMFVTGVAVIYAASSSPMHELSEDFLASAHMLQHLAYTLIAPPLLIFGTPAWLIRIPLRNAGVYRTARLLTHPLVAFGTFNAVQLLTHLPSSVDFALTHEWFHFTVHAALVSSSLMMWWPVLSPVEELPRLSYPLQMAYLFVQSLLPAVMASFLTFSTGVFYSAYAEAPRIWGLTPVEDQQFAGFVMKILGSLILWGFIGFAFFKWYEREQRDSVDPRWEEVREELLRLGLNADTPTRGEIR